MRNHVILMVGVTSISIVGGWDVFVIYESEEMGKYRSPVDSKHT